MKRSRRQPPRVAPATWAAYVVGHHLSALQVWARNLWGCRELFAEGRIEMKAKEPEELAELAVAIDVLDGRLPRLSVSIGRAVEATETVVSAMLRELKAGEQDLLEWSNPAPPTSRHLGDLRPEIEAALSGYPHYLAWFLLGEKVAAAWEYWGRLPPHVLTEWIAAARDLEAAGRYPFLGGLLHALGFRGIAAVPPAEPADFVDPIKKGVTADRVDRFLRDALRTGGEPRPQVVARPDHILFFGRPFRKSDLHPAGWGVLQALCASPQTPLSRHDIIRATGLKCEARDLPPHVSRLRKSLKPAVDGFFDGRPVPEAADDAFVVSVRGRAGAYQLDVARELVDVVHPRRGA